MFCTKCGNGLEDGARFCGACGEGVRTEDAAVFNPDIGVKDASSEAPDIPGASLLNAGASLIGSISPTAIAMAICAVLTILATLFMP